MVIKKVSSLLLVFTMAVGNLFAQFDANKTYVISNRNDVNLYIQDNGGASVALGSLNDNSYWTFEATANTNCYYVKNATTGKYMQSCKSREVEVVMGDSPVEYSIILCTAEGDGMFGMASTDQTTFDFTAGTIGCNWKGNNTVQGFAAVSGTNHRSFWKIVEQEIPQPISTFDANKKYALKNYAADGYLKDDRSNILRVESTKTSNALWQFEATANENCYYVKNALTGRYIQSTKADGLQEGVNGPDILMGTTKKEIKLVNDPAKGDNIFGIASTDQSNLSFSGNETAGVNWRKDSNIAQSYFANTGTDNNPRSFWKVEEVETVDFADDADNTAVIAAAVGDGKNAVVTRTVANGMWNTLVVPHAMNEYAIARNFGSDAKVAELTSSANGALSFATVTAIEAGKPYLVKPTVDVVNIITLNTTVAAELVPTTNVGDYQFIGLYAPTAIGTDDYFMAANNTLVKNGESGTMKAFRAYFHPSSSSVKALTTFDVDDMTTGIILPDGQVYEGTTMYNLVGQQVRPKNVKQGIYIINGKKVLVK